MRFLLLCFLLSNWLFAQEDEPPKFEANGYLKYLHSSTFSYLPVPGTPPGFSYFPLTNPFFHHRLNLGYHPQSAWTLSVPDRGESTGRPRLAWSPSVRNFGSQ